MAKSEKTSKDIARKASKLLSNPKTPKDVKSVAASALTQYQIRKRKSSKNSGFGVPPVQIFGGG